MNKSLLVKLNIFLLLLLMGCIFIISSGIVNAQLAISPAYIDIRLDEGRPVGQFVINNVGDKEERYRVQSIFFDFSKDGVLNRVESDEHSLSKWMIFNPKEFKLAPKTRRIVRFVIIPRGELRPGEYWAAMQLESLNTVVGESTDASGRSMRLEVVPQIMVPIFAQFGKINDAGVIRDTKIISKDNKATLETKVWNTGNGRLLLSGEYQIFDIAGKLVEKGDLSKVYLLPNGERIFKAEIKAAIPNGKYKVKIDYSSPQLEKPLIEQIDIDI